MSNHDKIDTITVSVDDLYDLVRQIHQDGFKRVRLSLDPAFLDDGELCPATLNAEGIYESDPSGSCVYDPVEAVSDD